jgi:hypothetical protein
MEVVIDGVRVSLHECQKRFKHQRWNCTLSPEHRTFFGPTFKIGTTVIGQIYIIILLELGVEQTDSLSLIRLVPFFQIVGL